MVGILPLRFGTPMPFDNGSGSNSGSSPVSSTLAALARRHLVQRDDDDDYVWFWYSTTGVVIKYTLFFSLLLLIVLWVVGGRIHAKRRLQRGLKPMGYHAWLLSRQERAQVDPAYAYPQEVHVYGVYRPAYGNNPGNGDYYSMHPVPPPVYDPNRPPVYDGPPTKVDPAQAQEPAPDYAPPAGPPPGASTRYS